MSYYVGYTIENGKALVSQAKKVDNILARKDVDIDYHLRSMLDGYKVLDHSSYYEIVDQWSNRKYDTTDHAVIVVKAADIYFVYISLGNSTKSNLNGHPLYKRLHNLVVLIQQILHDLKYKVILFLSEACRSSFDGDKDNRTNTVTWIQMREYIETSCLLYFLTERKNSDEYNDTVFGISVFYCIEIKDRIKTYHSENILQGKSSIVAVTVDDITICAVHFPLDNTNIGKANDGYKCMVNLQQVMDKYNFYCAFGGFGTTLGIAEDAINMAIQEHYEFKNKDQLTFFASYFDVTNMDISSINTNNILPICP